MSFDVPDACTLPMAERPTRLAEFDALFRDAIDVEVIAPTRARLHLAGEPEPVRDLTARETECCSFFTFTVAGKPAGGLTLDVEVPLPYAGVLAALIDRALAS